ncbi:HNH endonuclease [Mucilaginibacter psychrotolerans]|uniref:HNH endonuclease n=1 Tax=Mucilaginibacter psychrotolerans TaxID=1524096 RepID=A0A4Y8S6S0_9SPHI|nr:HNH endonuclease [Mucilaginibacter psychrotolerans]TFF34305.1 HNH endonuclease [Mucilaginibacter psychrotolerans]
MDFYLGVTDNSWYRYLSIINPEDINFWQPGGSLNFKALNPGAPFLFKLKAPLNVIGGMGFFSSHTFLPISVAWEAFGERNGCASYDDFRKKIISYRGNKTDVNPQIGCIVLTDPIFFETEDWIEVPENWSKSIVQGKTYSTEEEIGQKLWSKVDLLLSKYLDNRIPEENQFMVKEPEARYGNVLSKIRLGQGAFRVLVTDAYQRKCSITGEKTLPVLESAHIKSFSKDGPHATSNGILLRSDIHKLFDSGYLTITTDLKVEVSNRIKEEFLNGKEYYQYHGKELLTVPTKIIDRPNTQYIEWHNSNVFRG